MFLLSLTIYWKSYSKQTKYLVGSKFSSYVEGGGSCYGVRNKYKFCLGGWVWNNLSCYNLFLQFLYYRRRNKQRLRETVVFMLSFGALERSNNLCVESIVEPCVSKNQKGIFAIWVWLGRNSWKAEAMEKSIPQLKAEFVCMCVTEKNDSFGFMYSNHSKVYMKCKSPIQKGF